MEDGSGRATGLTEVRKWEVRKTVCIGWQCKSMRFPNFSYCLHCLVVLNGLGSSKELERLFSTGLQCKQAGKRISLPKLWRLGGRFALQRSAKLGWKQFGASGSFSTRP